MTAFLLVVVGLPALAALLAIVLYNRLVSLRNQAKNAWSQIDVQLKRRHDLIPNLVETVKGYAGHEQTTLQAVTAARAAAVAAGNAGGRIQAEGQLSAALSRLLAVAERYPDLKANQNFLALQEELSSTENKIGFARQAYNDAVMQYNTGRETFPASAVAGMFGFLPMEHFAIADAADRAVPQVSFSAR